MSACVFCERIEKGEFDDTAHNGVVCFEPLNPVVEGHMLFVPKKHVYDAADGPLESSFAFFAASVYGQFQAEDFNLITNSGEAASQTIMHLHVHYVPRTEGDGLHLPWTGQPKDSRWQDRAWKHYEDIGRFREL